MWKTFKQWWKYLAMKLHVLHEERADPKVQLEQAIQEAKEQDRRLRDQTASVIANQKQAQARLDKAIAEYERANSLAEQALVLADQEHKSGNAQKSTRFEENAESLAGKVLTLEGEIGELEQQLLQATKDADQARAAVDQNGATLQRRLAEQEKLLNKLDRAKLREQMNKTMDDLGTTVGADVPTFAEVEKKIENRLARAEAHGEISERRAANSTDAVTVEVEHALRSAEAQAWLSERRAKLGLAQPQAATNDGRAEPRD
jgi:phage shock protein A